MGWGTCRGGGGAALGKWSEKVSQKNLRLQRQRCMETWERNPREGVVGCSDRNKHDIVEGQRKGQLGA